MNKFSIQKKDLLQAYVVGGSLTPNRTKDAYTEVSNLRNSKSGTYPNKFSIIGVPGASRAGGWVLQAITERKKI